MTTTERAPTKYESSPTRDPFALYTPVSRVSRCMIAPAGLVARPEMDRVVGAVAHGFSASESNGPPAVDASVLPSGENAIAVTVVL